MKKYETKVQELDVHRKEITGGTIRILREKRKLTQKEIAEKY